MAGGYTPSPAMPIATSSSQSRSNLSSPGSSQLLGSRSIDSFYSNSPSSPVISSPHYTSGYSAHGFGARPLGSWRSGSFGQRADTGSAVSSVFEKMREQKALQAKLQSAA